MRSQKQQANTFDAMSLYLCSGQVGDRLGVVRKEDGTLHFTVNGVDQGQAAAVYGVIDLFGQAAQVTVIDEWDNYFLLNIVAHPFTLCYSLWQL